MMSPEFAEVARQWVADLAVDPAEWRDATDAEVLEHIADWYPDGVAGFTADLRGLRLVQWGCKHWTQEAGQ